MYAYFLQAANFCRLDQIRKGERPPSKHDALRESCPEWKRTTHSANVCSYDNGCMMSACGVYVSAQQDFKHLEITHDEHALNKLLR